MKEGNRAGDPAHAGIDRIPAEEERPGALDDPEKIRALIRDELEERPPKPWTEINRKVVNDLTEEVDAAQSEFQEAVTDAVLSRLSETDLVTVGSSQRTP